MIKLTVSMVTGHEYNVIFGADQDQVAAEFVARKRNQVNIAHVGETAETDPEATPVPDSWIKTLTVLYPVCCHGLSAYQCMDANGEHHWGTAEWEREFYGDNADGDHYDGWDDVDYNAIANDYEAQYGW